MALDKLGTFENLEHMIIKLGRQTVMKNWKAVEDLKNK